jgi:hypothetical protein
MTESANEVTYSIAISVMVLMICAFYLGNVIHAFITAELSEAVIYGIRYISAPLAIFSCLMLFGLIMSARIAFHEREASLEKFAVNGILLARSVNYSFGEKGKPVLDALQGYVDHLTSDRPLAIVGSPQKKYSEPVWQAVNALPENSVVVTSDSHIQVRQNENYISNKNLAKEFVSHLTEARMELAVKQRSPVKSTTVLIVTLWFAALFYSLGLTSPWMNRTTLVYGMIAAGCIASGVVLLAEYASPVTGFVQLSSQPLHALNEALAELR